MAKSSKEASFEEFLAAPERIAGMDAGLSTGKPRQSDEAKQSRSRSASSPSRVKKEKVGLTIDPAIIEAVDDYIYQERKRGKRLKKNDVYEMALRQFLGLEKGGRS